MKRTEVNQFSNLEETRAHYLDELGKRAAAACPPMHVQMAHQRKREQAVKGDGPLIRAEANKRGISVKAMCDMVIDAADSSLAFEDAVEVARIAAQQAIRQAETPQDMYNALEAFPF